jgi:hypothetical protein
LERDRKEMCEKVGRTERKGRKEIRDDHTKIYLPDKI